MRILGIETSCDETAAAVVVVCFYWPLCFGVASLCMVLDWNLRIQYAIYIVATYAFQLTDFFKSLI